MSYDALVEDLIETQMDVFGAEAVEMARRVGGIDVADDGSVERLHRDGAAVVDDLVSVYVSDLGGAATVTLKSAASAYEDDLELPGSLR